MKVARIERMLGYSSWALVLVVWSSFWIPLRLWPPARDGDMYLVATIMAGLAGVTGVIAGWKGSKWWYFPAILGFVTCALLLAGVAV